MMANGDRWIAPVNWASPCTDPSNEFAWGGMERLEILHPYPERTAPPRPDREAEDWRDNPSADERWNAGLEYGMTQLCAVLGVDPKTINWDAATETLDGDVGAVLGNILCARFGEDWPALLTAREPGAEPKREYRLLGISETVQSDDEVLAGDARSWKPPAKWQIGMRATQSLVVRRALSAAPTGGEHA
jgi:hypothetical protein